MAVNACLTPLCSVEGAAVVTVEGIGSTSDGLHPVQVSGTDSVLPGEYYLSLLQCIQGFCGVEYDCIQILNSKAMVNLVLRDCGGCWEHSTGTSTRAGELLSR